MTDWASLVIDLTYLRGTISVDDYTAFNQDLIVGVGLRFDL